MDDSDDRCEACLMDVLGSLGASCTDGEIFGRASVMDGESGSICFFSCIDETIRSRLSVGGDLDGERGGDADSTKELSVVLTVDGRGVRLLRGAA